jgi:hypothetical protein
VEPDPRLPPRRAGDDVDGAEGDMRDISLQNNERDGKPSRVTERIDETSFSISRKGRGMDAMNCSGIVRLFRSNFRHQSNSREN